MLLLIIDAGAALATEDQQQRLDLEQEQLLTRLPWLRRPPVFRWFLPVALSISFPHRLLHLGDAE